MQINRDNIVRNLLYLDPPKQNIRRQIFMNYAQLRMSFYSELDNRNEELDTMVEMGAEPRFDWQKVTQSFSEEQRDFLRSLTRDEITYKGSNYSKDDIKEWDCISYYVCRLACSIDESLRLRFCDYESKILRMRMSKLRSDQVISIIQMLLQKTKRDEEIVQLDSEQIASKKQNIYSGLRYKKDYDEWKPVVWRLPVRCCGFLLDRRQCYVQAGYAYVDEALLVKIATKIYHRYLIDGMKRLETIARGILDDDQQNQYRPFVQSAPSLMNKVASLPEDLKQVVNLNNLAFFAKQSFPPCMLNLYNRITKDKHLKNQARIQLTLFLKGCGLPVEDNMKFWKANYKKGISEADEKGVQYGVKHLYGKEGGKKDYAPYNCHTIINFKVGSGQHHGCPFKHLGTEELKGFLTRNYKLSADDANQIVTKMDNKHYEVACRSTFMKVHEEPKALDQVAILVGGNPNRFFYASRKYYEHLNNKEPVSASKPTPKP